MSADRTVHGRTSDGMFLVRYGRAGKWYVEFIGSRTQVCAAWVAHLACRPGATWTYGLPGGQRLDAMVRQLQSVGAS